MKLRILFVSSVLTLALIGCVSEFDAKLPFNDIQILIVDGSITEGEATFYLSRNYPLDSSVVSNLDMEAKLTIFDSNENHSQPAIKKDSTVTRTINGRKEEVREAYWIVAVGELSNEMEYGIQIEYNGDIYRSTLSKPLRTPEIDSISWVQPAREGAVSFRISTHDDNTNGSKFFLWNYTENWEITAEFATTIFYGYGSPTRPQGYYIDMPAPYYYCWKKDVSNKILIGSTESLGENRIVNQQFFEVAAGNDRFSVLYCITVYQKAITKEAHEYYQNKSQFNDEMGGLFTPQPSEEKGNITCVTDPAKRVIGYVETVRNITQKRIFVYETEITRPNINHDCQETLHESVVPTWAASHVDFYRMGYRPAGSPSMSGTFPVKWAKRSCTDCTAKANSTKDKPDFWPNDHE